MDEEAYLFFGFGDPLFQSFKPLIDSISVQEVVFKYRVRPLAEASCVD